MRLGVIGLSPDTGIARDPDAILSELWQGSLATIDAGRPSHQVAQSMQNLGYEIIPINPEASGKTILGQTTVGSFREVAGTSVAKEAPLLLP
jgi:hypothetical protein